MHKPIEHKPLDFNENVKLNNIDVWKTVPEFDYEQWSESTVAHLCNVKWDADYLHTVDWTIVNRDNYFAGINKVTISNLHNLKFTTNTTSIKLAVPMQSVIDYNYIVIEDQAEPVSGSSSRKLFYFILDVSQLSPDAISLTVSLDVWTTYLTQCTIRQVQLIRGHAPVLWTTPDNYLSNPMKNTIGLTGIEAIRGEITRIAHSLSFSGSNNFIYVLHTSLDMVKLINTGEVDDHPYLPWAFKGEAAQGTNVTAFFDAFCDAFPQVVANTIGVSVVDPQIADIEEEQASWGGVTIGKLAESGLELVHAYTPTDFGYPDKYANITKLYTSQYATQVLTWKSSLQNGRTQYSLEQSGNSTGMVLNSSSTSGLIAHVIRTQCPDGSGDTLRVATMTDSISANGDIFKNTMEATQKSAALNQNATAYANAIRALNMGNTSREIEKNRGIDDNASDVNLINEQTLNIRDRMSALMTYDNTYTTASTAIAAGITEAKAAINLGSSLMQAGISKSTGSAMGSVANGLTSGVSSVLGAVSNTAIAGLGVTRNTDVTAYESTFTQSQANLSVINNNEIRDHMVAAIDADIANHTAQETAMASASKSANDASVNAPFIDARNKAAVVGSRHWDWLFSMTNTLRTATIDIITRAGEAMLRYGYNYSTILDNPTLSITPKYTYWQCGDVMITGNVANVVKQSIANIMQNVTIYRNPDEVQSVTTGDNRW